MPVIPFMGASPDHAQLGNPGDISAENVTPRADGYGPFRNLSVVSDSLADPAHAAISVKANDGSTYVIAADDEALYRAGADLSFSDVSQVGGYTTPSTQSWELDVWFPGEQVIATNGADDIQVATIDSGLFADLIPGGNTHRPTACHLAVLRNFVMLGNTNDSTFGLQPSALWWSAINDPTDFELDTQNTSSDREVLSEGGAVTQIVGGAEYGVVFQERLIRRLEYAGAGIGWSPIPADRVRGTIFGRSVIPLGRDIFYWSNEGAFVFSGGARSTPIGVNRVDRRIRDTISFPNREFVTAAIDRPNKVILWGVPTSGSTDRKASRLFLYHWERDRWSEVDVEVQTLVNVIRPGNTWDDNPNISTSPDDAGLVGRSPDEAIYRGGDLLLSAFDTSNRLATFDGATLKASVTTTEAQLINGQRSLITGVRPLLDGIDSDLADKITIYVGGRTRTFDTPAFRAGIRLNADGYAPVRDNNRYHRFKVEIDAGTEWEHLQGVEIPAEMIAPMGVR